MTEIDRSVRATDPAGSRPAGHVQHTGRARACGARCRSRRLLGRDAGRRRRVGLGQERDDAGDHGAGDRRPRHRFGDAIDGTELVGLPPARLRAIRGSKVSMIFQDPMTSLNPVLTIGRQLSLVMRAHQPDLTKQAAAARAVELVDRVAISQAQRRCGSYPHELSGGMRQRIMIAMAIANNPQVLIADEPTTALDVTVQAQIMELLDELRRESGLALVLITHDLGVVAGSADRVAVMYAGRIAETGSVRPVVRRAGAPLHPRACSTACPAWTFATTSRRRFPVFRSHRSSLPPGCPFAPRCSFAVPACEDDRASADAARRDDGGVRRVDRVQGPRDERADPARRRPGQGVPRPRRGPVGGGARRQWRQLRAATGRDPGARRRVRLRQVDDRSLHPAADRADQRHGRVSRRRTCCG